jgi:uncharacterized damage-inducible protein DinB
MNTLSSDPLDILLGHDDWGTRRVLELCRKLTPEQYRRPFPIGPGEKGGLCATITHIIGAKFRWADRIGGRTLRPFLEGTDRTPEQLLGLLDAAHADMTAALAEARAKGLAGLIDVQFEGKTYRFTRGAALTHVLTHGHWHRAQCLNMLRQLGVFAGPEKAPELDVVDWQFEVECGGLL